MVNADASPAANGTSSTSSGADPILLSLFANRFMAIAESMGASLYVLSFPCDLERSADSIRATQAADFDID
jgi:N-methylhydantoinase B/oxoprolinase/acetone carboxylase alpha subunit